MHTTPNSGINHNYAKASESNTELNVAEVHIQYKNTTLVLSAAGTIAIEIARTFRLGPKRTVRDKRLGKAMAMREFEIMR